MTLPEILDALTTSTGRFPEAAVRAAVEQRDAITPELLRVLESVAEDPEAHARKAKYLLPTYAVYLLAYFRETGAYRPILEILSGPGESPADLFGDTLTGRMSNILASTYDGDPEPLRRLVEDDRLNVWARSAAIESFVALAASGQLPGSEVAKYFGELLAGRLPRIRSFVWDALADAVGNLPAPELLAAVEKSFEEGLHEDHPSAFDIIVQYAAMSPQARASVMAERYGPIGHPVDEMSWWAAFDKEDAAPRRRRPGRNPPAWTTSEPGSVATVGPVVRQQPKVGRNDPCPCGSGKKYKKCCLEKPSGLGEG